MSVTVTEISNRTQVSETSALVSVSEITPSLTVTENNTIVEVKESPIFAEILEVGHLVTVTAGGATVVEVQTPGPKGDPATSEKGPAFTYTGGLVSRVDYDSGAYKTLSYASGRLAQVDYVKDGTTIRKTFFYDNAGTLTEVVETTI